MAYGRYHCVWTNHHVIADMHRADIEDRQIEIASEVITDCLLTSMMMWPSSCAIISFAVF